MTAVILAQVCTAVLAASTGPECPGFGDAGVVAALRPIRERHDVPAIAGAIVTSRGLDVIGGAGVRKRGAAVGITADDVWHLGSCTKAMTAVVMARLVEDGKVGWESTLAEVLRDMAADFNPGFRGVTVGQLLSHRAGLPKDLTWRDFAGAGDVRERRREVARRALAVPPQSEPGARCLYSNLGYVIAGAVIEAATGKAWEANIRAMVFEPLGMKSAGFGGTGTPGKLDQPWGHFADGRPAPKNGPEVDNPPVIGPAGRVHCTIQDWAKFVADQLRGDRGEQGLLKGVAYRRLHDPPPGGDYAFGWGVHDRSWGGRVLNHTGSNTMNYANVWVAPAKDFAVLVCINQGGDVAFKASDEAAGALIRLHESRTAK